MFRSSCILSALAFLGLLASGRTESVGQERVRVGTYDTRAVAVAFAPSRFNPVGEKMREYEKAKQAKDSELMHELEAWGESQQQRLHYQGFCRVPVDDLLAPLKEQLVAVAQKHDLDLITAFNDYKTERVELVDITDDLVRLYEPSEKTLATIKDLLSHPALNIEKVENDH
jgi:hypothetical protein